MKTLNIVGPFKGVTGHDNTTRSLVRALHARGIKIGLRDLPVWSPAKLPPEHMDPWFEQFTGPIESEVELHICMPQQVERRSNRQAVNLTMFEADRIPASWAEHSRSHDLVVVPVESSRKAWEKSGVPSEKIVLCPLGVDTSRFAPGVVPATFKNRAGQMVSQFKTRFLNVSDAIDRKNLVGLLRVWLHATRADDNAVLILKPGFYAAGSRQSFDKGIAEMQAAAGRKLSQAAPVFFIPPGLPINVVPNIFATATHYISMSFGEGFDLPMVEAAASGLHLVAPAHSAYLDYLNDRIAYMLPTKETPARMPSDPGTNEFFKDAFWWEPDFDHAITVVRSIIDGTAEHKQQPLNALAHLTWTNMAERLEHLLLP